MIDFLISNWISIASIFIGFGGSYLFYRLQQNNSVSASSERTKHATVELLDVVESYIINKQDLSRSLIDNLIQASERFHTVLLRPSCTPVTLLQDVALRLQRSRHLNIPQKTEYSTKIDELITKVKSELEPLTWEKMKADTAQIISGVLEVVPEEHKEQVEKSLHVLGMIGEIAKNEGLLVSMADKVGPSSWMSVTAMGVAASLAVSVVASRVFFGSGDLLSSEEGRLILILATGTIAVLSAAVGVQAFRSYFRYREVIKDF
ncbi:hypothetical protein [Pseudomonas fluorescens]|uniref:Transmembrane protein n=1 Tax=Pseudomonas fluorescens TaxID=294 RepID=A0A7Z3H205_PSEFL|nr:hypothetical protein [Pseudomonas fluorescens]QJP97034.1 hypothetical protein C6Y56_21575 [Pseudomonas fluorescens]